MIKYSVVYYSVVTPQSTQEHGLVGKLWLGRETEKTWC